MHPLFDRLLARARTLPRIATAIVYPCDPDAIRAAFSARSEGLIRPLLVGPVLRIREASAEAGVDLGEVELVDTSDDPVAATRAAIRLAQSGRADALMKGSLHTDELMGPVVEKDSGLRTNRRITHAFVMAIPGYPKLLTITDAVVNITPDLATKRDIAQNAAELLHRLGIELPRIAVLSAVETVNPAIASSLDAAALSKMADRGQIRGALVDGPLGFDNAVSAAAARTKGIQSSVAGEADVLLVPNLETGNMLYKQLAYLARAELAGLVLGARVPVVLTSRADPVEARLLSCALAVLAAHPAAAPGS